MAETTTTTQQETTGENVEPVGVQVPSDFDEVQAAAIKAEDKKAYIIGGLVLLGGFLIMRHLSKKKKK